MSFPLMLVTEYKEIFVGNPNGKGQSRIGSDRNAEGKLKTESWVSKVPISDEDYNLHLEGKMGLGLSPILPNNKCLFGVIDIDDYNLDVTKYINIIYKFDLPLVPFYSKSKGLHLYMFFSEEVVAAEVISLLQTLRKILGLPKDTEVFPKQRTIPADGLGNWINLPYYDADNKDDPRKVVGKDIELLDFETGLDLCRKSRRSLENYKLILSNLPLADAPPCLQSIYLQRDTFYRNEYLFSLARYYKAKIGDNFEFELTEANNLLLRPIEIAELEKSVIRSHKKKDYSYKCGGPPIQAICDKDECKKRTFGIGSDFISDLSYEEFIQYKSDPPWYEWTVNGQPLQFFTEMDIINQAKFRELCFRKLHVLPCRLKDSVWSNIVNNALKNVSVKEVDLADDISTGRMFMEYVTEFMSGRVMADNKEQILINRVYEDSEHHAYIFKSTALVEFLYNVKNFRVYRDVEIQSRLKQMGAGPIRYYVSQTSRSVRVWQLPKIALEGFKGNVGMSDVLVDFLEKEKTGDAF